MTYLEEDAFTSGLLAKKAKVDDSRDYPLNQESDFIHKPFSYQLVDHDALSLPKIPPSGDHGHFGAQHSKRRIEEREKENEKKNLETIQEKSEVKEKHPIKDSSNY